MRPHFLRLLSATLLAFAFVNNMGIEWQPGKSEQIQVGQLQANGDHAVARRSGGRSRSGSFGGSRSSPSRSSRPSSPSRSSGSDSSPSRPTRSNSSPSRSNSPVYQPAPIIIDSDRHSPTRSGSSSSGSSSSSPTASSNSDDALFFLLMVLLVLGSIGVGILVFYLLNRRSTAATRELENDVVTVTKLQVALLAEARQIQTELTKLAIAVDTNSPEGKNQLLQESVLALLRSPENWTHAAVSSQTVKNRGDAGRLFEQLSIQERSKFDVETLANVGGRIRRLAMSLEASEPAAYIVVTLLIGTEHDRPLVEQIHTTEALQTALQAIATLPPASLSVFELLWSPQDAADSLTYDELLTQYSNLIQLA